MTCEIEPLTDGELADILERSSDRFCADGWDAKTVRRLALDLRRTMDGRDRLVTENARLRAHIMQGQAVVAAGMALMPLSRLGKWEGVRAWLETEI